MKIKSLSCLFAFLLISFSNANANANASSYIMRIKVEDVRASKSVKLHSYKISSYGGDDTATIGEIKVSSIIYDNVEYLTTRSWQVLVIDPETYFVESRRIFDVYDSRTNAYSMKTFLESIQKGMLVMFSTHDEPSRYSDVFYDLISLDYGAELIKEFSKPENVDSKFRSSYFLVGYKGGIKLDEEWSGRYTNGVTTDINYIKP